MNVPEIILLALLLALGVFASITDIRDGLIYNKMIVAFLAAALLADIAYYGFFAGEQLSVFLINTGIFAALLLCLYYARCFAGGDLKLGMVLALLYPAGMYVTYANAQITLFFALAFSIFFGYLYLLGFSAIQIVRGTSKVNGDYIKQYLKRYIRSYITAFVYIVAINLILAIISQNLISIPAWIAWVLCFAVAWISRRVTIMRNRWVLGAVILLDIALSIVLRAVPISLNPGTYAFTAVLILCQMTVSSCLYQEVPTDQVQAGMILSTYSSLRMRGSRVSNLPGVSREDLRDRLTPEQAESVRRWAGSAHGQPTVTIMRKIPFAIFLLLGFAAYLLLWRYTT